MPNQPSFPKHGRLDCSRCFKSPSINLQELGKWKMRNDPGAWGSQSPKYLVLGFSKGATQTDLYENGNFDEVAFGGEKTRENLTNILRAVGVLLMGETVDQRIRAREQDFHFGSLVRCSLSRLDEKETAKRGRTIYATSGALITKSFKEIPEIISQCTSTYLANIPKSVKVVFALGVTDAYIRHFRERMKSLHPKGFRVINEVAYRNDDFLWVHLTHPSRGNGTIRAWLSATAEDTSGRKRLRAIEALQTAAIN